jgi:polar amino acid transport system permease protein
MAEASKVSTAPRAHRPRRLSFAARARWWWLFWFGLFLFFFSGVQFTLFGRTFTTIALDWSFMAEWWRFISRGVIITLQLALVSIVGAMVLALLAALARLSRIAPLYSLAGIYISLMRGTPLFLQVLFIYLALPQVGIVLDSYSSGVLALSLNYGAYMSEIFRAGIQAVGYGQTEAAYALGMSPSQTLRRIVLPQAFRIILPDIGNQFIAMQKDTALVSAIGLAELMGLARQAGAPRQHLFEALIIAAVWYWALTVVLTFFQSRLETWLARSDRHAPEP